MITKDEGSGTFVVWLQSDDMGSRLLGQHFDQLGNPLWNPNGAIIDSVLTGEFFPAFLRGVPGGLLVGIRQQLPVFRWLVLRVDALARPVWTLPGISPCDSCTPEELVVNFGDEGDTFMAWSHRLPDGSLALAAQRIGPDGTRWWGSDGVNVTSGGGAKQKLRAIAGPNGGAYVVWQDLGPVNPRITAQRLNVDGTPAWAVTGVRILSVGRDQDQPTLASDGSGGLIIGLQASRAAEPTNIICQSLESSGQARWGAEGEPVAPPTARRTNATAISTGNGAAILLWEQGERTAYGLCATRISSSGFSGVQPAARLQDSAFLWNPFPSPAADGATIRFTTRAAMTVELVVCDLAGRIVKTLIQGQLEPDSYGIAWNGRDETGRSVKAGVYFVAFKTPLGQLSRKIVVL